jgi:hypothetical protein
MERIKRMIDNQKQISGENSIQIQNKDGNVTIQQGITYTEIEKIFLNLFEANFPKLLREANNEALENIKDMLEILKEKIDINKEKIDMLKVSSTNVQYHINNAMLNVGRKGKKIDISMLTDTLISLFENNQNEVFDLVLEEALNIIPKMTKKGVLYLSMIYFYYYSIFNFLNVEDEFKEFEKIFKVTFEINEVEILYLETLGCLSSEKGIILGARLQKQIEKGYKIDYEHNTYFKELNKKLEANRINQLFLTPLGWFIAILNLRKYYTYINIKAGFEE